MCDIEFDYSALRGAIKEVYGSETRFASEIEISTVSLSSKLNNKTGFTESEMLKAMEKLNKSIEDIPRYFFNKKLKKT